MKNYKSINIRTGDQVWSHGLQFGGPNCERDTGSHLVIGVASSGQMTNHRTVKALRA